MIRTIAAITTPLMISPIHVIRVSGPQAFEVVNKIIKTPIKKNHQTIQHNYIIDEKNQIIDEVLINIFIQPNTFTGENIVEINNHGNPLITKKILNLLIINGAEYAKPGEFSMQALINNKMDYYQIEAMNNLITTNNDQASKIAINSLLKKDHHILEQLKHAIFMIMGSIEVNIDYPEYDDVPQYTHNQIIDMLIPIHTQIEQIYINSKTFLPIINGINLAIIGKPNVGKSSLLNLLSKDEKAIVSNIEGTTRDVIESQINFDGYTIKLLDTAGIRETSNDEIEKLGINKAYDVINRADLIIWLLDGSETDFEIQTFESKLKNKQYLKIYNKSDINHYDKNKITISVKNQDINNLIKALKEMLLKYDFTSSNILILQSERQVTLIYQCLQIIDELMVHLKQQEPLDLLQNYFEELINLLNQIIGEAFDYDKLDELFKHFCLGK